MSNEVQNSNANRKYDLEERTAIVGEKRIEYAESIPKNLINNPLISQIVRSGTSEETISLVIESFLPR
ncbi:hypothetical protein BMS3Abin05_01482 [bacterium BMS3Abin05]|nr:hypothetical protein BMS3Abin05_01482 [bacterium BMS3Abin05]GBE27992.1 hypothetical protein BMS3Bbin03_01927 [bacterium BMS3Bbin03]HDZ10703.1 hypothetical protein [Bacteroidota bacterium]